MAKSAEVVTNDPQRERFTLALSLTIVSDDSPQGSRIGAFIVGPSNRSTLRVARGASANGSITIYGSSQPVRILNLSPNGEAFSVNLNTLAEGKRYSLSFVSSPKLPVGNHKQTVKLTTDSKETPELEIFLEVVVIDPVSVHPSPLTFENVPVSDPEAVISAVTKLLRVRLERGVGMEITSIDSDLPFLKVKKESVYGNGQMILLRVGFNEKPPKGTHQGVIRIETNIPNAKVIEVPVTVNAQ